MWEYTPFNLTSTGKQIIAPFFADVDTRFSSAPVTYGAGTVDGYSAYAVNWVSVNCYRAEEHDIRNSFQVVLIERSDTGSDNFDIEFNYDSILWEAGTASGADNTCTGGTSARIGYSNGTGDPGTSFELAGSAVPGAFLDDGPENTALIHNSLNSNVLGRYIFSARNGTIPSPVDPDTDGDGIFDTSDNCPAVANVDQADNDGDGAGDACDDDDDDDGVLDTTDNCVFTPNADQSDADGDGVGDICDGDSDGDGIENGTDNCPVHPNTDQTNTDNDADGDECDTDDDNDGILDTADNCPITVNPSQSDLDNDNIGDLCDIDLDGDGVNNSADNCPENDNPGQDDTDFDGAGDACDLDDDDDGILDEQDNCSLIPNTDQTDTDGDGQGDPCDGDLDGDGFANDEDNCPADPNTNQNDFDSDGLGDVCDPDSDGDGVDNNIDTCAESPIGSIVDPSTGCSIAQLCPCAGPRGTTVSWRNHGKYVSCTAKTSESFVDLGLITDIEKDEIMSDAGQSTCGHKNKR